MITTHSLSFTFDHTARAPPRSSSSDCMPRAKMGDVEVIEAVVPGHRALWMKVGNDDIKRSEAMFIQSDTPIPRSDGGSSALPLILRALNRWADAFPDAVAFHKQASDTEFVVAIDEPVNTTIARVWIRTDRRSAMTFENELAGEVREFQTYGELESLIGEAAASIIQTRAEIAGNDA